MGKSTYHPATYGNILDKPGISSWKLQNKEALGREGLRMDIWKKIPGISGMRPQRGWALGTHITLRQKNP